MEICPGVISAIIFGIKKGLNLGIPSEAAKPRTSFSKVARPPIPDPQITPTRFLSTLSSIIREWETASLAATIPNWVLRSIFFDSFLSKWFNGSKPFTSQANFVLKFEASKRVIGAAPLLPFTRFSQYSFVLLPIGVTAPNPVTTTLFNSINYYFLLKKYYLFTTSSM